MKRLQTVAVAIALVSTAAAVSALPIVTVRAGHNDRITELAFLAEEGLLFSAADDGKMIVWDSESGRLLQSIRADQLPIRSVEVYPDGERVAIYSSDGRRHRITVWNWREGVREFLHTAEDEVLTMRVSAQMSYLVYSTPALRSLVVLDAQTGRGLPFLRQNTGIVTWMVIASSEERVMTYTPSSGEIVYRNVITGSSAGTFSAPPELSLPTILESRRFAAARGRGGDLVVVDLLSGAQVASAEAGEIQSIELDPQNGDILVLTRSPSDTRSVRRFRFQDGRLQDRFSIRRVIPARANPVRVTGRTMFAGMPDGSITRWLPFESEPVAFAEPKLERVSDLFVDDSRLHMLTPRRILSLTSDFFDAQGSAGDQTTFVSERVLSLVAGERSSFIPTGRSRLLLWTPAGTDRRLYLHRLGSTRLAPVDLQIEGGLLSADADEERVLVLTRAGVLELRNYRTGRNILTYRGRGLQTAIQTPRGIYVGKAEQGVLDSAILRLTPRTGETVPVDAESDLVFFLRYDPQRGRLFALGVRETGDGEVFTIMEVFDGPNLSRRRTILEIPGEYLDAEIVLDEVTGSAYTTLDDRGGILRWDGTRTTELARNQSHIPEKLFLQGDLIYSLNRDGTVSVIDRFSGRPVLDLYVVADTGGEWIALRPDGRFYASDDRLASGQYLSVTREDVQLETRRLALDARSRSDASDDQPMHRFESGRDEENVEETEQFDPFSGDPAPSS